MIIDINKKYIKRLLPINPSIPSMKLKKFINADINNNKKINVKK